MLTKNEFTMNFQKTYARSPKIVNFIMGMMFLIISLQSLYSWLSGSSTLTQSVSTDKDVPLAWILLFSGAVSYYFLNDFFYYRKKMMAGYNDSGLYVYNEPTNSYIFILWNDLNHTSTSFGSGGFNMQGLIIFDFKKATLCQVDKNSSYINNIGHCDLQILDEVELGEDSCAVNFGYWSWKPYTIKKEIKKRSTL